MSYLLLAPEASTNTREALARLQAVSSVTEHLRRSEARWLQCFVQSPCRDEVHGEYIKLTFTGSHTSPGTEPPLSRVAKPDANGSLCFLECLFFDALKFYLRSALATKSAHSDR